MTTPLTLVPGSDLIAELRELTPSRSLSWTEAHSVAERQATRLLELSSIAEPPVPQFIICNLPGIVVDWLQDWPAEATSFKAGSYWRVVVRASDVRQRQRFSLAHELKHIVDDPYIDHLLARLPADQRHERAERLCNWFAACLLMPRGWLKRDWGNGMQQVSILARRYFVSEEAMRTRLSDLGLTSMSIAPVPRSRTRRTA